MRIRNSLSATKTPRCLLDRGKLSANSTASRERRKRRSVRRLFRDYPSPRTLRFLAIIVDSFVYWRNLGVNTDRAHRDFISARDRTVFGRTHASPEPETRPAKIRTSKLKYFPFYRKTDKNMYSPTDGLLPPSPLLLCVLRVVNSVAPLPFRETRGSCSCSCSRDGERSGE